MATGDAAVTTTETITGVSGTAAASLEGVTPTLTYYSGTTSLGSTAPTAPGTYTVVASFAGSTDYAPAASPARQLYHTECRRPNPRLHAGRRRVNRSSTVSSITLNFNEAVNFSTASFTLANRKTTLRGQLSTRE